MAPHPPASARQGHIGQPVTRIDGMLKVTGQARYPSDVAVPKPAYAYLVLSAIAKGRIEAMDLDAARHVPGVIDIMTAENTARDLHDPRMFQKGGFAVSTMMPLTSNEILFDGQIIAMVLAESFEAAREAAYRVAVTYRAETPSAGFDAPGADTKTVPDSKAFEAPQVGDAQTALAGAAVRIDQRYSTPTQHHNAIELFTTTCFWTDGKLTIHEPSQFMYGLKNGMADELQIDPANVHAISQFVGGGFGSKAGITPRSVLTALAARRLNRPVKLVATRDQGFVVATYRAETRHRIQLGADAQGKLVALVHDGIEVSSRADDYKVGGIDATTRMYACPNVASSVSITHADRNTPGFMRAPAETPYMFPLESAMDELAVALKIDPVELRRINDTQVEPIKGLPYTSRSLMQCFDQAAAAFGWAKRNPEPGSMRDGDWQIGWGCATGCYPTLIAPAAARIRLDHDGKVKVETAGHEIGNGAYTAYAIVAADRLGVPVANVEVRLGDSDLPPAPVAGGSNSTGSIASVIADGCEQLRDRLARAAVADTASPLSGRDPATLVLSEGQLRDPASNASEPLAKAVERLGQSSVEVYAENIPDGIAPDAGKGMAKGELKMIGGSRDPKHMRFAFSANFVEVRVHRLTREVRVPRVVAAFAAGTIVNPLAARSQLMGGLIWGLSSALHEATEIDPRQARYVNADLADYLIPVNADVPSIEVIIVPEEDKIVNPLGIKGIGELGIVGVNAAVANAVWHATVIRIRDLPIRLDALLSA